MPTNDPQGWATASTIFVAGGDYNRVFGAFQGGTGALEQF